MTSLESASLDTASSDVASPAVASGPNHHLVRNPASSTMLVIFSATGKSEGRFDYWKATLGLDCNVLLLNNGLNEWYQNGIPGWGGSIEATVEALRTLISDLGCDRVLTFGSSMGGYGAILFGSLLDAEVLTFGFDSLLRPNISRASRLMEPGVEVKVADLRPVVSRSKGTVTAYVGEADPIDLLAASRISSLKNVRIKTLRGVGHNGARHLNQTLPIGDVLKAFANGRPLPSFPAAGQLGGAGRDVFHAYFHFNHGNLDEAQRFAERAIDLEPFSEIAHYYLGRVASARGNSREAIASLSMALASAPHFEDAHFHLTQAYIAAKDNLRALSMAERGVKSWPESARCHYVFARTLWGQRRHDEARSALREAVRMKPSKESWSTLLEAWSRGT